MKDDGTMEIVGEEKTRLFKELEQYRPRAVKLFDDLHGVLDQLYEEIKAKHGERFAAAGIEVLFEMGVTVTLESMYREHSVQAAKKILEVLENRKKENWK